MNFMIPKKDAHFIIHGAVSVDTVEMEKSFEEDVITSMIFGTIDVWPTKKDIDNQSIGYFMRKKPLASCERTGSKRSMLVRSQQHDLSQSLAVGHHAQGMGGVFEGEEVGGQGIEIDRA